MIHEKRTDNLDFIKIKNLCSAKDKDKENKTSHTLGENVAEDTSSKGLYGKYTKF